MTSCKVQEANFLTLHKKSAWERALLVNLDASDRGLRIRQGFEYALDREMTLEELTGGVTVTDFAVGPCHLLYILDARARTIWVYDSYQESIERIECIGALLNAPTSITYAPGTLYVADTDAARRVVALAEVNWQIRWAVGDETRPLAEGFTPTEPFTPVDLAVGEAGDLYALDGANRAVLKFDAGGRLAGVFGYAQLKASDPDFRHLLDTGPSDITTVSDFVKNNQTDIGVTLANLATTIADDSACIDDQQFLRLLFPALLGREITARELAGLSRELQHGVSRSEMAWRLGNSDEVRAQVQR